MGQWIGCNHESSEERLADGKKGLAYKINCNQMNVDRPWEKGNFFIFLGGELFLVNLDVTGFLDHTCMQINKNNIINKKNQPSLF